MRIGVRRAVRAAVMLWPIVLPRSAAADEPAPPPGVPAAPTGSPAGSNPPKPAVREPSAGDVATARVALQEGVALREKGELEPAISRLRTAYDLVPTPVTAFELGKTQMMAGRILQAHEMFKKIEYSPKAIEESSRSESARTEARRLADQLEPRIPSLLVSLKLAPGANAVVTVDDEDVTMTGPETKRLVDPGKHVVVARAGDGPEQRVAIEIGESESKKVELAPQWIPPKKPANDTSGRVVVVRDSKTSALTIIGFAGASASLALTIASGYILIGAQDDVRDKCGQTYCPEGIRDHEIARRNQWAVITLIAGASTIGFLAAGIVGVATPPKEKVTAGIRPVVGLMGGGVEGRFW